MTTVASEECCEQLRYQTASGAEFYFSARPSRSELYIFKDWLEEQGLEEQAEVLLVWLALTEPSEKPPHKDKARKKLEKRLVELTEKGVVLPLPCKVVGPGIEMRYVPPGAFWMGSPKWEKERQESEQLHQVILTEGFWMSRFPVTQKQWTEVMGVNPSHFRGPNLPEGMTSSDDLPVETVSWNDCQEFLKKLREEYQPPYPSADLPHEVQWEYSCRAGTLTPFFWGETLSTDQANFDGTSPYNGGPVGVYRGHTTPLGTFLPNALGLEDMHGNVWEWCANPYGKFPKGTKRFGKSTQDPFEGYLTGLALSGEAKKQGSRRVLERMFPAQVVEEQRRREGEQSQSPTARFEAAASSAQSPTAQTVNRLHSTVASVQNTQDSSSWEDEQGSDFTIPVTEAAGRVETSAVQPQTVAPYKDSSPEITSASDLWEDEESSDPPVFSREEAAGSLQPTEAEQHSTAFTAEKVATRSLDSDLWVGEHGSDPSRLSEGEATPPLMKGVEPPEESGSKQHSSTSSWESDSWEDEHRLYPPVEAVAVTTETTAVVRQNEASADITTSTGVWASVSSESDAPNGVIRGSSWGEGHWKPRSAMPSFYLAHWQDAAFGFRIIGL